MASSAATAPSMTASAAILKNFNVKFHYRTSLPSPPCGPYFHNVDILRSLDEGLPEYRTSTLEKSFVWQPHFGPDMGIKLDLVDQESIVIPDRPAPLDPSEMKYLNGSNTDKSKGKLKSFDQESKPWWLRNTTYLENNPFNKGKVAEDDLVQRGMAAKSRLVDQTKDLFGVDLVDDSFSKVEATVQRLIAEKKNAHLLWGAPFIPQASADRAEGSRKRQLVRFDEDPKLITKAVPHGADAGVDQVKRFKVDHGLITNERAVIRHDDTVLASTVDVSLVAPDADSVNGHGSRYHWVKDYRMELQDAGSTDCFLLVVNEGTGSAYFFPITSRMDMRKLGPDASKPLECVVHREEE